MWKLSRNVLTRDSHQNMTSQMQATIQSLEPVLQERLALIVEARQVDVENVRSKTTPWKSLVQDEEFSEDDRSQHKIKRITGTGVDDADGLQRVERWAEEVVSAALR